MPLTDQQTGHIEDVYNKCLHCGLCLPVCPTYNIRFAEESSPRGRVSLIYSALVRKLDYSERFVDQMYYCLDCQACETACPAGVHFAELLEETRNTISERKLESFGFRFFKKIFLNFVLGSPSRIKRGAKLLRFYQRSWINEAVIRSGILRLFSEELHEKQFLVPRIDDTFFSEEVAEVIPNRGAYRGRVAFLTGCIMDVAFVRTHRDSVRVLTENGYEVVVPKNQVCCGSLHAHNGEISKARELAKKNMDIFGRYEFDHLVADSAGCSAFIKEYGRIFSGDPVYGGKASGLASKTKEITEFLGEAGLVCGLNRIEKKVTYDDACHLVHTQKISSQPRELIRKIPGIEFIEMQESAWCCGSAGIYNIVRYQDSMKILERKMENIRATGASYLLTANPGCHLQLEYGVKKFGLGITVLHPVSVISLSMRNSL